MGIKALRGLVILLFLVTVYSFSVLAASGTSAQGVEDIFAIRRYYDKLNLTNVKNNSLIYTLMAAEDQENIDSVMSAIVRGESMVPLAHSMSNSKCLEFIYLFLAEYGEFVTVKDLHIADIESDTVHSLAIEYLTDVTALDIRALVDLLQEVERSLDTYCWDRSNLFARSNRIMELVWSRSEWVGDQVHVLYWLRDGKVNCVGYSRIFGILARANGIKTSFIGGLIVQDDIPYGHLWNVVDTGTVDRNKEVIYKHVDVGGRIVLLDEAVFLGENIFSLPYRHFALTYFRTNILYSNITLSL